jgi:hypothetical protein
MLTRRLWSDRVYGSSVFAASEVTGYLVGTLDRFNNAKRAEERDRVKHANFKTASGRPEID